MAKYVWVTAKGMFTYALDECEDYLLLNAYLQIKQSHKFENTKTLRIFEWYHLQEGGTLNDNILMQLNSNLRMLGRPGLSFVNGHTTNYAAMRGQDKVLRRQEICDQLESLTPDQREALIALKENEVSRLPERSLDLPVQAPPDAGGLQRAEVERRRNALALSQKKDAELGTKNGLRQPDKAAAIEDSDRDSGPESTLQDNVVELLTEMSELRQAVVASQEEIASLKLLLQSIFKIQSPRKRAVKEKKSK